MSVLQVLHIPDERLRKVAKPVEEVNAEIQRIVDDMFETMYAEEGIGLAATQVDIFSLKTCVGKILFKFVLIHTQLSFCVNIGFKQIH